MDINMIGQDQAPQIDFFSNTNKQVSDLEQNFTRNNLTTEIGLASLGIERTPRGIKLDSNTGLP